MLDNKLFEEPQLINREFVGKIVKGKDPTKEGRYKVYIPELLEFDPNHKPIYAKNETQGARFVRWIDPDTKANLSSGTYSPLYKGMEVNVRFRNESIESAYITNIISHNPLPDKKEKRDEFHLINASKKKTWIYTDDDKEVHQILHLEGNSTIVFEKDRMFHGVGTPIGGGSKDLIPENQMEITKKGTRFEYKNVTMVIDDTGWKVTVGNNVMHMTINGLSIGVGGDKGMVDINANGKIKIQSDHQKITARESFNQFANETRIRGNQQLNLAGDEMSINSSSATSMCSSGYVEVKSTIKTKLTGPVVEITSDTNLAVESPMLSFKNSIFTLKSDNIAIAGSNIVMDGQITHALGIGSSVANSMATSHTALCKSLDAAGAAISASKSLTDPTCGTIANAMVDQCPGAAVSTGVMHPPELCTCPNIAAGIKELSTSILSLNDSYGVLNKEDFGEVSKNPVSLSNTEEVISEDSSLEDLTELIKKAKT